MATSSLPARSSVTIGVFRYMTTVLVAVLAAGFAGCSGEDTKQPRSDPPSTISPTPTGNAEGNAAREASLAAYNGYREAYVKAAETADANNPDLAKYVAHPLLGQLQADLQLKRQQGLIVTGRPTWNAHVTAVNTSARPFTVDIEDCFDATNWKTVRTATGEPAGVPGQATKYVVVARATQYDDGRWLIREATAQRERPC